MSQSQGKTILILHGWGSSSEKWREVGKFLSRNNFQVIAPDLPGFGKSPVPPKAWDIDDYVEWVKNFIAQQKLESFFLLGHSFGGSLAIKFVLKYPEKVQKLILVAPACIRKKTLKKQILAKISKIFGFFSFLPFYSLVRKMFYKFIVGKSDYLYFNGVMRESYLKIINQDLSDKLSLLKVPTTIIWGKKDDVVPLKDAYLINKKMANSKLMVIPEGDHDMEQRLPDVLSKKILENISYNY